MQGLRIKTTPEDTLAMCQANWKAIGQASRTWRPRRYLWGTTQARWKYWAGNPCRVSAWPENLNH